MRWAREYFNGIRKTAQRAQDLAGIIEYGRIHSSTGGAHGSAISDKTAIEAARVMAAENEIVQCKEVLDEAMNVIRGFERKFSNDWIIIKKHYIECKSWSMVAKETGMVKSTLRTKTLIMFAFADSLGMAKLKEYGAKMLNEN